MYIAQKKRKENIAEYILYLWQLEDLLRALQFSPEAIYSQLVAPTAGDEEQKQHLLIWYIEFTNLMRGEGKETHGHLDHTMHLIKDLQNLHQQLMSLPVGARYRTLFAKLDGELPALRKALGKEDTDDIELCFRALYSVVLHRIKGIKDGAAPAPEAYISDVIETISPVVAELAKIYGHVERGEIDLFKS